MITKFHGIDRHNKYSTISVLNRKGEEIDFKPKCSDLKEYMNNLGPEDAVILEASTGAFYLADRMESRGSVCYVIDPHKFRIIKDSYTCTQTSSN
jgi:transposase